MKFPKRFYVVLILATLGAIFSLLQVINVLSPKPVREAQTIRHAIPPMVEEGKPESLTKCGPPLQEMK